MLDTKFHVNPQTTNSTDFFSVLQLMKERRKIIKNKIKRKIFLFCVSVIKNEEQKS